MDFNYYEVIRLILLIAVLGGFGLHFYRYYKKYGEMTKGPTVYVLLGLVLIFMFLSPVKMDTIENKERVIRTFDTVPDNKPLEIERITREKYEPNYKD